MLVSTLGKNGQVLDQDGGKDDESPTLKEATHSPTLETSEDAKIIEVVNADLAIALSTGPQLSPYSKSSIQLFLILLVAYMGSLSNGFDGSGESILTSQYKLQVLYIH